MPVRIEMTSASPGDVRFAVSPLAELVAALHVLTEPVHHPLQASWAAATASRLPRDLRDALCTGAYLWRTSRADLLLPAEPAATLAEELDRLDAVADTDWVAGVLLTSSCGVVPLRPDLRDPLHDPAARDLALERAAARGPDATAFVDRLLADPGTVRAWFREVVERSADVFFAELWTGLGPSLQAEARVRSDRLAAAGLATLDDLTPGLRLRDGWIVVDKLRDAATSAAGRGVTFLPSAFADPHVLVVHDPRRTPVVQYPLPSTVSGSEPGLEIVQLRLRALDSPVRLRLLASILRGTRTTADLADAWSLTAPEVSRHLAVLRRAGLVRPVRSGRFVRYEADLLVIGGLGSDLVAALVR